VSLRPGRPQLHVAMHPKVDEALRYVAEETASTKSAAMARGVMLYKTLLEITEQGGLIYVIEPDGTRRDIIILD
jgi:hypothetical protein